MAELKVEVLRIENVTVHPNADRLDLATVLGYQVVVGRDQYKVGDLAVYFPVDSILPSDVQDVIFANSKMKLSKNRVRAARIRGAMSFGLLVDVLTIKQCYLKDKSFNARESFWDDGKDLTEMLGVKKYEPPVKGSPRMQGNSVPKKHHHPDFKKYTSIQHLKRNLKFVEDYKGVMVVTEKIHGTNFRAAWVEFQPRTFKQRVLKKLSDWTCWNFVPQYEFVYGSHNVQLQDGKVSNAHANVYKAAVDKFNLKEKIPFGEEWFFEIFGTHGGAIQKNYQYGLTDSFDIRVIDIMVTGQEPRYMPWVDVIICCQHAGLMSAPIAEVMDGIDMEALESMLNDPTPVSKLDGKTPMEGFVVRPMKDDVVTPAGRMVMKLISDEYLLNKSNTDYH